MSTLTNFTIELDSVGAIIGTPDITMPMRLDWTNYPDAFALYMELLTERRVQVSRLRLSTKDTKAGIADYR